MKMRKRIAALLAVAMVAALMPMTAFAASTSRLTHDPIKVVKGGNNINQGQKLEIELKDGLKDGDQFYVNLTGAEWDNSAVKVTSDAALTVDGGTLTVRAQRDITKEDEAVIEIDVKAKEINGDDEGKAWISVEGWGTAVTTDKEPKLFATVSDAKASVKVDEDNAPKIYTGSNGVATFEIEELYPGQLKGKTLIFALENGDYEFTNAKNQTVNGSKGLAAVKNNVKVNGAKKYEENVSVKTNSKADEVHVTVGAAGTVRGVLSVSLQVKPEGAVREPATGDIYVEISHDDPQPVVDKKSYKVATVAEYGVELKLTDDKEYEFFAGRTEKVKFELNELIKDSMVEGRVIDFKLPEGVYFKEDTNSIKIDNNKSDATANIVHLKEDTENKGAITGFSLENPQRKADKDLATFKIEAELNIPAGFEGDVVLTVESRAFDNEEIKLATVKPAIKVTVEPTTLKVGLKEQAGGKIIIEELEKGALKRGEDLVVLLERYSDFKFKDDVDVKVVKGDIKFAKEDKVKVYDNGIVLDVKRASREASTIEITNVKLLLDRAVPEGSYGVEISGSAVSYIDYYKGQDNNGNAEFYQEYENDKIVAKDYIFVGEKYTRPETVFTIGEATFTVNGEERTMDAAAYVKDGRTMVPVRYLAYALGINEDSIKFNSGIVTIYAEDGKVIQLANNDKNLVVNGMNIPMVAAAEIVDGRTYVPVTEIGGVFGITGTWDPATQTATFK